MEGVIHEGKANNRMNEAINGTSAARTYEVQPDGRIQLRIFFAVGDRASAATPWHERRNPMIVSLSEVARDCALPEDEVVGRDYTASGDANALHDFRLVNDPRI